MNNEYEFFKQFAGVTEEDLQAYKCGGKTKKIQKDCGGGCTFKKKIQQGAKLKELLPYKSSAANNGPHPLGNSNNSIKGFSPAPKRPNIDTNKINSNNKVYNNIKRKTNNQPFGPKKDPTNDKINNTGYKVPYKDDKINAPKQNSRFKPL